MQGNVPHVKLCWVTLDEGKNDVKMPAFETDPKRPRVIKMLMLSMYATKQSEVKVKQFLRYDFQC